MHTHYHANSSSRTVSKDGHNAVFFLQNIGHHHVLDKSWLAPMTQMLTLTWNSLPSFFCCSLLEERNPFSQPWQSVNQHYNNDSMPLSRDFHHHLLQHLLFQTLFLILRCKKQMQVCTTHATIYISCYTQAWTRGLSTSIDHSVIQFLKRNWLVWSPYFLTPLYFKRGERTKTTLKSWNYYNPKTIPCSFGGMVVMYFGVLSTL